MNNQKLSFSEMKEIINLFHQLKLNALKIGDLELQKTHYEVSSSDKNISLQNIQSEDAMFYSAPPLPPELEQFMLDNAKRK